MARATYSEEVTDEGNGVSEAPNEGTEVHWHVQIFELRKTVNRLLGGRKRVSAGFGWSASGDPDGYEYHPGPFRSREAAAEDARKVLTDLGGTLSDMTDSTSGIDVDS